MTTIDLKKMKQKNTTSKKVVSQNFYGSFAIVLYDNGTTEKVTLR